MEESEQIDEQIDGHMKEQRWSVYRVHEVCRLLFATAVTDNLECTRANRNIVEYHEMSLGAHMILHKRRSSQARPYATTVLNGCRVAGCTRPSLLFDLKNAVPRVSDKL